jgi:hypothetical protein
MSLSINRSGAIERVSITATKMLAAAAIFGVAACFYGCASSDPNDTAAAAASCQGAGDQACADSDNARQLRDAAAYQSEPELGYVNSPPGMLPMPLTSRNPRP